MKKIFLISLPFILIILGVYIYHITIPSYYFKNTVHSFEEACRTENIDQFKSIVSKDSRLFEYSKELKKIKSQFEKFETENEIKSVALSNIENNQDTLEVIFGEIIKIAKIDGEPRYFSDIILVKENDKWVIQQFPFPDLVDY